MKSSLKTIILWVFVILLSTSLFIYFGDTSTSFTPGNQNLGTVNGFPIVNKRISEFADNYRSLQERYESQGFDVSEYQQVLMGEAFRKAVIGILVKEQAEKAKIVVSDTEVVESIKDDYFKGDVEEFNSFIETGDTGVQRDLEALVRNRFIKAYYEDVLRGITFTKAQLEERTNVASYRRSALIAVMNINSQLEKVVTLEVLETYYQDNISRYNIGSNTTLESVKDDVRSDYLLENQENIIANIQNSISLQFQAARTNQITERTFRDIANENDMLVAPTSYFNFFSSGISLEKGQGQPLISDRAIIRGFALLPVNTVSDIITLEKSIAVIYIRDEVVDKEVSDFVKNTYITRLQEEVWNQLFTAYYISLYDRAEIEVNNQSSQQQQ